MRKRFLILILLSLGRPLCPADRPSAAQLDDAFARLAAYEHGSDRTPLSALDQWLRQTQGAPELARELESRLIALVSGKATPAGVEEACRRLSIIGTSRAVPALARLLAHPAAAEFARYALERIPGQEATLALRSAVPQASGNLQISLINSLGARRDGRAVALLDKLARGPDEKVAAASIQALGRIGTAAACRSVNRLEVPSGSLRQVLWDAMLRCAENLSLAGRRKDAYAAYEQIYRAGPSSVIRAAALRPLARLDSVRARTLLEPALRGGDPILQAAAIGALAELEGAGGVAVLRREFPELNPRSQAQVLSALAERADASLRTWFAEAAAEGPTEVRLAAIEGIGKFGDAQDVPWLAALAGAGEEPVAGAARRALITLRGKDVDSVIADQMVRAAPKIRVELARAAAERCATEANAALLQAARDEDRDVRREALRALAVTATENELGALAGLVAQPVSAADLREAQKTLAGALSRLEKAPVDAVLAAYGTATAPDPRAALLAAMAQSGRPEFLPRLRQELQSSDPPTRRAAIVALGQWPAPDPMPDLLEAARRDASPALRTLALRGYLRLAGLPARRTPAQTAALLGEAMKLAAQAEEKKSILALLARAPCPEALALAEAAVGDPAVAVEAKAAVESIRKSLQLETMDK